MYSFKQNCNLHLAEELLKLSEKAVISGQTALYLWHLQEECPLKTEVSLPVSEAVHEPHASNIVIHPELDPAYSLGLSKITLENGKEALIYDEERCICDLIRNRKAIDKKFYLKTLYTYFNQARCLDRLIAYAKNLGILDQVMLYTDVVA